MEFKKIEIADIPVFESFLRHQPYKTCDFTLLATYMWANYFNYEFAIKNDTLFARERSEKGVRYFLPISKKLSLVESLTRLKEFVAAEVDLLSIPECIISEIDGAFNASFELNRDWSDYLYNASDMLTLSGKKYNKKRNLIHQFEKLYQYELVPISSENISEVIQFAQTEDNGEELSDLARYESEATLNVLKNYATYDAHIDLYGYVLYVDKKVVGFEICEYRNDVLFVHIEKADRNYKGAHQILFWLTLNAIHKITDFNYVNREEDVGDEGLRKAKLSYYPIEILNKYDVKLL